jgi:hypothetical protein
MYFEDTIDEVKYCGHLFGLGSSLFQNGMPYESTANIYMAPQTLVAVAQSVAASQAASMSNQNGSSKLEQVLYCFKQKKRRKMRNYNGEFYIVSL